jgi:hypothetical protein
LNNFPSDEFRGHSLLSACANCDVVKMKKILAADTASFQHPFSLDSPLVSYDILSQLSTLFV